MNAVILGSKVNDDETQATYICLYILRSTCRTDLIQNALNRTAFWQSGARSLNIFESFFTTLDNFEVGRRVKTR